MNRRYITLQGKKLNYGEKKRGVSVYKAQGETPNQSQNMREPGKITSKNTPSENTSSVIT